MLKLCREVEDTILHLRVNEPEIGTLILKTLGDGTKVLAHDAFIAANRDHWFAREISLYWKRVMKLIDVTSRSLVALVVPGSCFAGSSQNQGLPLTAATCSKASVRAITVRVRKKRLPPLQFRPLPDEQRFEPSADPVPWRP